MTKLQKVIQKHYEDNKRNESLMPITDLIDYLFINKLITLEEKRYLDKCQSIEINAYLDAFIKIQKEG